MFQVRLRKEVDDRDRRQPVRRSAKVEPIFIRPKFHEKNHEKFHEKSAPKGSIWRIFHEIFPGSGISRPSPSGSDIFRRKDYPQRACQKLWQSDGKAVDKQEE